MTLGNGDSLAGEFWKNQLVDGDYICLDADLTLKISVWNPQNPPEIDNTTMDLIQLNQLANNPEIEFNIGDDEDPDEGQNRRNPALGDEYYPGALDPIFRDPQ